MPDFWPASAYPQLAHDAHGGLLPTPGWWRTWLDRPELAPVDDSCRSERALHERLRQQPTLAVNEATLAQLADADARANYRVFLKFRDAVLAAGTLQAWYTRWFRAAPAWPCPPLFIDLVAQSIARHLMDGVDDAHQVRAAELLFRAQRITVQNGRVLSADRDAADLLQDTGGLGSLGRLLVQGGAPLAPVQMQVLSDDNAAAYWASGDRHHFVLDLTHEVTHDLSHGLVLRMARTRSGLKALAQVLVRWVQHLLGVEVTVTPLPQVDDPAWRWHLGLDAEATALLNALYQGEAVEPEQMKRLISLFRLEFIHPQDMRADVAGKPVYLGLAMAADGTLKLKPQNLLLNLPLAHTV